MVRVFTLALFGLTNAVTLKSMMKDQGAALEAEYRQLLQDAIKRSKNPNDQAYVPNPDKLKEATDLFKFLENDLLTQRAENQELIDHANNQVTKCNDNRNSFFRAPDTGIDALATKADNARSTHSTCRNDEQTAINKYTASKANFDGQSSAGCGQEQNWWADPTTGGAGTLDALVQAGVTAHNDKQAKEAQEAQCDKDQQDFETAFCKYASLLDRTCQDYNTCYTAKTESREDIGTTVQELETSQKLVWKMIQKIECYIGKLKQATQTDADLTACVDMIPTAGELDITYTPPPGPLACDVSPGANKPGTQAWIDQEYSTSPMKELIDGAETTCSL